MRLSRIPPPDSNRRAKSDTHPQDRVVILECVYIFSLRTELLRRSLFAVRSFKVGRTNSNPKASDSSVTKVEGIAISTSWYLSHAVESCELGVIAVSGLGNWLEV